MRYYIYQLHFFFYLYELSDIGLNKVSDTNYLRSGKTRTLLKVLYKTIFILCNSYHLNVFKTKTRSFENIIDFRIFSTRPF